MKRKYLAILIYSASLLSMERPRECSATVKAPNQPPKKYGSLQPRNSSERQTRISHEAGEYQILFGGTLRIVRVEQREH